ncbi:MAG: hypothetical protein MZU97_03370 [Bacillus subtilis]|nr:hypothetical protein [Bacillus subtilis]
MELRSRHRSSRLTHGDQNRFIVLSVRRLFRVACSWCLMLNRLVLNAQAVDVAVVLGVPLSFVRGGRVSLGAESSPPTEFPRFEPMVLHPVRSALWLQLIGSLRAAFAEADVWRSGLVRRDLPVDLRRCRSNGSF